MANEGGAAVIAFLQQLAQWLSLGNPTANAIIQLVLGFVLVVALGAIVIWLTVAGVLIAGWVGFVIFYVSLPVIAVLAGYVVDLPDALRGRLTAPVGARSARKPGPPPST